MADLRTEAEALGYARSKPLDQHVRTIDETEEKVNALRIFKVDRNRTPTSPQEHPLGHWGIDSVDVDHGGPEVGEEHCAKWRRADTG